MGNRTSKEIRYEIIELDKRRRELINELNESSISEFEYMKGKYFIIDNMYIYVTKITVCDSGSSYACGLTGPNFIINRDRTGNGICRFDIYPSENGGGMVTADVYMTREMIKKMKEITKKDFISKFNETVLEITEKGFIKHE